MKIKNLKVYGLEESLLRSKYPMQTGEPPDLTESYIRNELFPINSKPLTAEKLAADPIGSGHDNFLIGINIQFDLCYPQYWTKHLQRYHWFQYFSGQSLMHKLVAVKSIKDNCNKYVLNVPAKIVDNLICNYNEHDFSKGWLQVYTDETDAVIVKDKEELFHYIISNCPMGYELWIPVNTNYLQLKNMYNQRKTHRLYDWKEFCQWIEELPMSHLITGKEK